MQRKKISELKSWKLIVHKDSPKGGEPGFTPTGTIICCLQQEASHCVTSSQDQGEHDL